MTAELYVPDADALIDIHRHFPDELDLLRNVAVKGQLCLVGGVYREVLRGTDQLRTAVERWVRHGVTLLEIDQDTTLQTEYGRIETTYGRSVRIGKQVYNAGFWNSPSGRKAADAQVVAAAKVLRRTVASDDKVVRAACFLEDVPCIPWQEFLRRIRPAKPIPLPLEPEPHE